MDLAMDILEGKKIPNPAEPKKWLRVRMQDRKWAIKYLSEHGFGRPAQMVELKDQRLPVPPVDDREFLRSLTDEELANLTVLAAKRQAFAASRTTAT